MKNPPQLTPNTLAKLKNSFMALYNYGAQGKTALIIVITVLHLWKSV